MMNTNVVVTPEKLGHALKVCRVSRGLSQMEAANAVGMNGQSLSNIERGKREPTIFTLGLLASEYHVRLSEIIALAEGGPVAIHIELAEPE